MSQDNAKNAIHFHFSAEATPQCEVRIHYSSSFQVPVSIRTQIASLGKTYPSVDTNSFLNICDHIDNMANANYQSFVNLGLSPIESYTFNTTPECVNCIQPLFKLLEPELNDNKEEKYTNIDFSPETLAAIKSIVESAVTKINKPSLFDKVQNRASLIYIIFELIIDAFTISQFGIVQACVEAILKLLEILKNKI